MATRNKQQKKQSTRLSKQSGSRPGARRRKRVRGKKR